MPNLFLLLASCQSPVLLLIKIRIFKTYFSIFNICLLYSLFILFSANINKNPRSMIRTCNKSVEQNTNDEQDYKEYDVCMMPKNLP